MADEQLIKPRELPAATTVFADDAIMTDNGSVVGKATPVQIINAGAPVPTEAEAIAGTDNSKRMTPLTVKQVLDSVTAPSVLRAQAWAESDTQPDPSIPGSMSAKSWAGEAEASADRVDLGALDAAVVATGEDRVQTGLDRIATGQDRVQTGQDRVQTGQDRVQTGQDVIATGEDRIQTGQDVIAAEAARDAAFVNADVYADTAAGLASTTTGDQFQVVEGDEIIRYQHDAGPVATEVARYPANSRVDFLARDASENGLFLSDQFGRAAIFVGQDGGVEMDSAYIERQFRGAWDKRATGFPWEINHVIWYGQSWAMGFDAAPVITNAQRHNTIAFNGGVRQQVSVADDPTRLQSFVPAVEIAETGTPEFPSASVGETGAVAFAHLVWDLIERDSNMRHDETGQQMLLSAPGEGSKTIDALSTGIYIARVYEQIDRGYALAQAAGKTYGVSAVTWMQQTNVSGNVAEYVTQLEALRVLIDTYAKSVTGQTEDVKLVTWQMYPRSNNPPNILSAKSVYDRFVVAADTYPHIICAGPSYQETTVNSGNSHFRAPGMAQLGEMFAVAYKRGVLDGEDYQPLRPVRLIRQGPVALLTLNPIGVLASDTIKVATISNFGFKLYESDGTTGIAISSAAIVGRDMIKLVSSGAIPEDAVLRYADTGTDLADANKWRGTIRDTAFDGDRSDRWLVAFQFPFDN